MAEPSPMERYAQRVARDAAIARRRSLTRRLGGPLIWKYVQVVPSVFTAVRISAGGVGHNPDETLQ